MVTTEISRQVRTSRIEAPVRRANPVINPSRGPGPSWLPMYIAPATPLPTMARATRAAREPDDHRVEDGPQSRPLPQRDPGEQHDKGDDDAHHAIRHGDVLDQPELQHPPRFEAEAGPQQQRHRGAKQDEPNHELSEAMGEMAGAQLFERVHRDEVDTAVDPPAQGPQWGHVSSSMRLVVGWGSSLPPTPKRNDDVHSKDRQSGRRPPRWLQ